MAGSNDGRGFAGMDASRRRQLAGEGGSASGGNFKNDPKRASKEGKRGAKAQPTAAKRLGGQHSHQSDD